MPESAHSDRTAVDPHIIITFRVEEYSLLQMSTQSHSHQSAFQHHDVIHLYRSSVHITSQGSLHEARHSSQSSSVASRENPTLLLKITTGCKNGAPLYNAESNLPLLHIQTEPPCPRTSANAGVSKPKTMFRLIHLSSSGPFLQLLYIAVLGSFCFPRRWGRI